MTATLTLADVARLTGVTRPAVNEWIQRFNSESNVPFPSPYGEHDGHPYYAITEIQDWLRETKLGHRDTAVKDALFYSSLYQMLLRNPARAALGLLDCNTALSPQDFSPSAAVIDSLTAAYQRAADNIPSDDPEADIAQAAEQVAEAAFGAAAALARLADDLSAQRQVTLSSRFTSRAMQAVSEALTLENPTPPIIPTDEYSLGFVTGLTRELEETLALNIGYRKDCAPDSLYWAELACRNVEFIDASEEIPANSLLVHAVPSPPKTAPEYFCLLYTSPSPRD